jgi:hypothetical protein
MHLPSSWRLQLLAANVRSGARRHYECHEMGGLTILALGPPVDPLKSLSRGRAVRGFLPRPDSTRAVARPALAFISARTARI